MFPDALLGPTAALIGAIAVITSLYKLVLMFIADLKTQRDVALTGWREADATMDRMAAALEARNRQDAERRRLADEPR